MTTRIFIATALLLATCALAVADDFQILPEKINGVPRGEMLSRHLLSQCDAALATRKAAYEE